MRRYLFTALLLSLYLATAGNTQSCWSPVHGQAAGEKLQIVVDPILLPAGKGPIDDVLAAADLTLPLSELVDGSFIGLNDVDEVYLNEIAIRSVVAEDDTAPLDFKGHSTRLADSSLIGPCSTGQAALDFVESLEIWISEPLTKIASYKRTEPGSCGFFLKPEIDPATGKAYNLRNFLPDYRIEVVGHGTMPSSAVRIGGYSAVDALIKF